MQFHKHFIEIKFFLTEKEIQLNKNLNITEIYFSFITMYYCFEFYNTFPQFFFFIKLCKHSVQIVYLIIILWTEFLVLRIH